MQGVPVGTPVMYFNVHLPSSEDICLCDMEVEGTSRKQSLCLYHPSAESPTQRGRQVKRESWGRELASHWKIRQFAPQICSDSFNLGRLKSWFTLRVQLNSGFLFLHELYNQVTTKLLSPHELLCGFLRVRTQSVPNVENTRDTEN